MQISISKEELSTLIQDAVRDAIHKEKVQLILQSIPVVSGEEMADIEHLYSKTPPKKIEIARTETIDV